MNEKDRLLNVTIKLLQENNEQDYTKIIYQKMRELLKSNFKYFNYCRWWIKDNALYFTVEDGKPYIKYLEPGFDIEETTQDYIVEGKPATEQVYRCKLKDVNSIQTKSNTYQIEYDEGAVQRQHTPIRTETVYGDKRDLMNFLNNLYVDGTENDNGRVKSFRTWVNEYEDYYDPSGSVVILRIQENGKDIYKNSDYDEYIKEHEDDIIEED